MSGKKNCFVAWCKGIFYYSHFLSIYFVWIFPHFFFKPMIYSFIYLWKGDDMPYYTITLLTLRLVLP